MVPREHSSGSRVWRGAIANNPHVRGVLVEVAWTSRLRPARSVHLLRQQEGIDQAILDISWKAQKRLYDRYRKMRARGKAQNVTIIALARELFGFIWAIGQEVGKAPA